MNTNSFIKQFSRQLFSLPILYNDSYEALRYLKGHLIVMILTILFIVMSFFKESSQLLRLPIEIIIPIILISLLSYISALYIYKKSGIDSDLFKKIDMLGKFIVVTNTIIIIYMTKDPRTAWWFAYFLLIVFISLLSEFHLFFFLIFTIYPLVIGILFITDEELMRLYSKFHRMYPLILGVISPVLYFYQCKIKKHEQSIKVNNILLMNELNEIKLTLERERISRDLHDSLGALLTGNIINSEIAREELYTNPKKTEEMLQTIEDLSRNALIQMREVVYSIMENKELLQDFNNYLYIRANDLLRMKNIRLDYHCQEDIGNFLSAKLKYQIYKTIGELLTNIIRHSKASDVVMKLESIDNKIRVYISDNGKGFDKDDKSESGRGLKNINFRIQDMGGEIQINSILGKGSEIEIIIPVKE